MATTRLSDVIVAPVFAPAVVRRNIQLSVLWRSGIIQVDPQIDALAKGNAGTAVLPFWNDLDGRSNVSSDDPTQRSVPNKITMGSDAAVKLFRNNSWASMRLVSALMGQKPLDVITTLVAEYWIREQQKIMFEFLEGVQASNDELDNGDMLLDLTGLTGDAAMLSAPAILMGKQQLGDRASFLTAIVMHSAVHTNLQIKGFIATANPAVVDVGWGTYAGYTVLVDDSVPTEVVGGEIIYTSFLFGRGAIAYGEGTPELPTEVQSDPSSGNGEGQEILHSRRHFLMHLRGVKWLGANMVGSSPTGAELANADNWRRVYSRKEIRMVVIKSKG